MKHVYEYPKFGKIDLTIAVNELFRMNKVTPLSVLKNHNIEPHQNCLEIGRISVRVVNLTILLLVILQCTAVDG